MKALYLSFDGSLRIDDIYVDRDGKPMRYVKVARLPKLRGFTKISESEIPLIEPEIDEYLAVAETRRYVVYEQIY